jgi:hypothetical protein
MPIHLAQSSHTTLASLIVCLSISLAMPVASCSALSLSMASSSIFETTTFHTTSSPKVSVRCETGICDRSLLPPHLTQPHGVGRHLVDGDLALHDQGGQHAADVFGLAR